MDFLNQLNEEEAKAEQIEDKLKDRKTINGNQVPFTVPQLLDAENFDVFSYAIKHDKFKDVVNWTFDIVQDKVDVYGGGKRVPIRYRDCVRHILFNAYRNHCIDLPTKVSLRAESFSAHKWYGMHWFSYDIFKKTLYALMELGLLDGVKGFHDRRGYEAKGFLTRFQATELLQSKFDEFLNEQVAERLPRDRVVILRDGEKNDIKLEGMTDYQYGLSLAGYHQIEQEINYYNDFSKDQEILLPLHNDTVTHDFLLKLRKWFGCSMIDLYKVNNKDITSYLYSILTYNNINQTNIDNKFTYNTIPLLERFFEMGGIEKVTHQAIPKTKNKGNKKVKLNNYLVHIRWNYIHRVFNNSSFLYGGRQFGTVVQGLPNRSKKVKITHLRNLLIFNGYPTVEPDYSANHGNILYNKILGIEYKDKFYEGYNDKKKVKFALLTMFNCKDGTDDRSRTVNAIRKKWFDEGYIATDGMRDDDVQEVIHFIEHKHPLLKPYFGTGVGIEMMRIESDILHDILLNLARRDIFASPIHDSLRVACIHKDELLKEMKACYFKHTGFYPKISD